MDSGNQEIRSTAFTAGETCRLPLQEKTANVPPANVTPNDKDKQRQKHWFSSPTDTFLSPCTQKLWSKNHQHPMLRRLTQEALKMQFQAKESSEDVTISQENMQVEDESME